MSAPALLVSALVATSTAGTASTAPSGSTIRLLTPPPAAVPPTTPAEAPAEAPAVAAPAPDPTPTPRWLLLTTDLAFVTVGAIGFARDDLALGGLGTLGFAFAAPAIHWGYGHQGKGFFSLAMHVSPSLLGLAGALLGEPLWSAFCDGTCGPSDEGWLHIGFAVGAGLAMVVDAFIISAPDAPGMSSVQWSPTLAPLEDGGMTAGVGGRF